MKRYIGYMRQLGLSEREISRQTGIPRSSLKRHIAGAKLPEKYAKQDYRKDYKRTSYQYAKDQVGSQHAKQISGASPVNTVQRIDDFQSTIQKLQDKYSKGKKNKRKVRKSIKESVKKSDKTIGEIETS